ILVALALAAVAAGPSDSVAQSEGPSAEQKNLPTPNRKEPLPKDLEGVGVTEKLGSVVPKNLVFTDSTGQTVRFGSLFDGEKPTLLTLNYSDCPMLCNLQLNVLVEGLAEMQWNLGDEYQVITVSLDPTEKVERAAATKTRYLNQYREDADPDGWRFMVGDEASIRKLTDSVGFGFQYSDERQEYLHQAAVMVLTPTGMVSRYLYGLTYSPQTVRLSMAEASEGKQVSTLDAIVLYCFYYDPNSRSYTPVVRNIMKVGGAVTVVLLGLFVGAGFTAKNRRRKAASVKTADGVA
ncbi:MAG: SCO family protein, partial [Myxococcota bacterium]